MMVRLRTSKPQQVLRHRTPWRSSMLPLPLLLAVLIILMVAVAVVVVVVVVPSRIQPPLKTLTPDLSGLAASRPNDTTIFHFQVPGKKAEEEISKTPTPEIERTIPSPVAVAPPPPPPQTNSRESDLSPGGPYHNWELFAADYEEMMQNLKIFVYPDATGNNSAASPFASVFLPHPNPLDPKIGNYYSEHAFKTALLHSPLLTPNPSDAHFFFMPFSINVMRNHPLLHSASSIVNFVADYTARISSDFKFWNASGGTDHFFVSCHSIGREATSKHQDLHNNAIQVTCSSSYFQRLYIAHKDLGLPQIWPRRQLKPLELNPPDSRNKLVFFSGRIQNSLIRRELLDSWGNDTSMDIFSGNLSYPYELGFQKSRFCLHVKGYEVNTARVSDAIHYGCIPVIISNHYDLPFANVLDWSKFSIIISHEDIGLLKKILMSVSREVYMEMYRNLGIVRRHFVWNTTTPTTYDSFYMTAYQLWLRRGLLRLSY